jgi:hypothetical protein
MLGFGAKQSPHFFSQNKSITTTSFLSLWNEAARKQAIYEMELSDEQVSAEAKAWLKNLMHS